MNIFLIVISGFNTSFKKINDMRRIQCKKYNIPVLFLFNGNVPEGYTLGEDERLLPIEAHNPAMYLKFQMGLREVFESYKEPFDYVVRVTSSTFLDFNKLPWMLSFLPKEKCHAGRFCWNDYGIYMSGPCMIFSRDVAYHFSQETQIHERVLSHSDDVMISRAVKEYSNFYDLNFFWKDTDLMLQLPTEANVLNKKDYHVIFRIKNNFIRGDAPWFEKETGEQIDIRFWELFIKLTDNF